MFLQWQNTQNIQRTILKCTIQQYFIHSQCYVNTTSIKFQNLFIMPKRNPLPAEESLPFLPTPSPW